MGRYVLGVTGASGVVLAYKAISVIGDEHEIELVMTPSALYTATLELGKEFGKAKAFAQGKKNVTVHSIHDVGSSISSGSYPIDGMVILPCSMTTLAAISIGLADNALRRAADVTIKEKRPLVIVPRESPLSTLHLENLLKLSRLGAVILPPMPAWYTEPKNLEEVEYFVIGKVFDALRIEHDLYRRWKS